MTKVKKSAISGKKRGTAEGVKVDDSGTYNQVNNTAALCRGYESAINN